MAKATYGQDAAPIPCGAFNADGSIYAYAVSYDWGRGFQVRHQGARQQRGVGALTALVHMATCVD